MDPTSPSGRFSLVPALPIVGATGALLLGSGVLFGYATHRLSLVRIPDGHGTEVVINTALGLVVGSLALLLGRRWARAGAALGGLVAALAYGVLAENLLGMDFGLDEYRWHLWLGPPNYNPGRMALNTSFALLCLGIALALLPIAVRWRLTAITRGLVWMAIVVCTAGLAGVLSRFDVLFAWTAYSRMAPVTAVGLLLLAAATWATCRAQWGQPAAAVPNAQRIVSFATAALAGMAIVGGCSGFFLLHGVLEQNTIAHLGQQLADRTFFVGSRLQDHSRLASALADRPGLRAALASGPRAADAWAQSALSLGFSAVTVSDDHARILARAGQSVAHPALGVSLRTAEDAQLLWSGHYVLRTTEFVPGVGRLELEAPLPELDQLGGPGSSFGSTGRFYLCAAAPSGAHCFPGRFHPRPFLLPAPRDGVARPLSAALAGTSGAMVSVDESQDRIIAAYAPIPDTGLGAALAMSLAEFYRPVRIQFWTMIPLLALLTLAGVLVLHRQIQPLIDDILAAHGRALDLARNDPLTGLLNRASFIERLEAALAHHADPARRGFLGLLYLDLDGLKPVNDSRGHAAGDALLREFARRLRASVRATDAVARLGGDEFTVLLDRLDGPQDAERVAACILESLREPVRLPDGPADIRTSIGVACHRGGPLDADDLLHRADLALYEAKREGRGRYAVHAGAAAG